MQDATSTELETLRTEWEQDYPGNTKTLITLRDHLAHADWQCRQTQTALHLFQQALNLTDLPMHLWDAQQHKQLTILQKQHSQAHHFFDRALKALQASYKPVENKKSQNAVPEPPPEPKPPSKGLHHQSAEITIKDGKVITDVDLDAAFWCRKQIWDTVKGFCRQFRFPDAVIPENYAYVLTHKGVTYDPVEDISIIYSPEEFARLCELEINTNSEHLLDGERLSYYRHNLSPP